MFITIYIILRTGRRINSIETYAMVDLYFEPGDDTTIRRLLRRTLQRQQVYSANDYLRVLMRKLPYF